MVTTVRKEIEFEAELAAALDERARVTGVPVDEIVASAVRHAFDDRESVRETRNGIRMVRRSKSGKPVTSDDVIALWEDLP